MNKKRGLGSGLNELLSDLKKIHPEEATAKSLLRNLAIDMLRPGKYQPRQEMNQEALAELADSIRTQGIIQPIIARQIGNGDYEIIAGERRWRAAQLADLREVPVVVREISDETAIALALIENIQREDLNAIDTAISLQRLIAEFNMTHEGIAAAVGKSRATVTNLLRLLDLVDEVKSMLQQGQLEMGHARALLTLGREQQIHAAKTIADKGLSVRATEKLAHALQNPHVAKKHIFDPNIHQLQKELSDKLAAHVVIKHGKNHKGKLIINYNSNDELEGILAHIK